MQVRSLGHAVLKVRDRRRSEEFYEGVLGIPVIRRDDRMTFFSLGNHHDLAVLEIGCDAPSPPAGAVGLFHLAFKVGDSHDELRAVRDELLVAGIEARAIDHGITESLYVRDPDGHVIELYVDMLPESEWAACEPRSDPLVV